MTPDKTHSIEAVEIAKLEGQMKEGFADLGGKIDRLISQLESSDRQRNEDRALSESRYQDHEDRLRNVEARKAIAPWQFWTGPGDYEGDRRWWYRAGLGTPGPSSPNFSVQYTSRRFMAVRGSGQESEASDSSPSGASTETWGSTPLQMVATVPAAIDLHRPYDTDPSPRLYRVDLWYDLLGSRGMWSTQQRGTAGGTSGSWPLKRGTTGSWPMSHRTRRF